MDFRNATAISIGEQSDLLNIKLVHIAEEQRGGQLYVGSIMMTMLIRANTYFVT